MESQYYIQKASWWVYIKIIADAVEYYVDEECDDVIKVDEGIWIKYTDNPKCKGEIFLHNDMMYLLKGLDMVKKQIKQYTKYKKTLIVIESLQYSPCDFQEEGLIAAMMKWSAMYFGFVMPAHNVTFDTINNKYVFDFLNKD